MRLAVDLPLAMPPVRPKINIGGTVAEGRSLDKRCAAAYDAPVSEFEHKRSQRVGQLVQEELGRLLVEGLKDPRVGFVTVTEVRLSDDLRAAHVYVSIFGADEARQESLEGLRAAAGFLRREIGHRLKLRYAPTLTFALDDSLDRAQRVQVLLSAVARGEHETPEDVPLEALPPVHTSRTGTGHVELPVPPAAPRRPSSRTGRSRRSGRPKRSSFK
jgi:ribosome-binding factor A